ncbi:MAG: hypothetical protein LBF15_05870 [Candidatus Peribacteria bacterium]|jgi:hypothetical protein|nr:hypothetical protein [Candidatus Peribacteria bacterium]
MIAFSYIDSDKSQWDYPICSPNVTEQEETEIRLGAVKSQLTDLHNRKPWSVKNILNSLEKMNFSKY